MSAPVRYVHMVATAYSGSTLLGMLLGSHPDLATVGELITPVRYGRIVQNGEHYPCSCGVPMIECAHFDALRARCRELGVELDLYDYGIKIQERGPSRHLPGAKRRAAAAVDRGRTIARALLDVTGRSVFLDTTKDLAPLPALARHPGLDLKVLHLIRDPRAFLHSTRKRQGAGAGSQTRFWRRTHEQALAAGRRLGPERFHTLRFEDLCREPERRLAEVCAFLGLPPANLLELAPRTTHHMMGNRARLAPFAGIALDATWEESLSTREQARCLRAAGPLATRFDYR